MLIRDQFSGGGYGLIVDDRKKSKKKLGTFPFPPVGLSGYPFPTSPTGLGDGPSFKGFGQDPFFDPGFDPYASTPDVAPPLPDVTPPVDTTTPSYDPGLVGAETPTSLPAEPAPSTGGDFWSSLGTLGLTLLRQGPAAIRAAQDAGLISSGQADAIRHRIAPPSRPPPKPSSSGIGAGGLLAAGAVAFLLLRKK